MKTIRRLAVVRTALAAAVLSLLAVCTGCTTTDDEALGRFTLISSQNVELSRLGEFTKSAKSVETKALNTNIHILIFKVKDKKVSENYQLENALESAVKQVPGGVALVDATLSSVDRTFRIPLFYKSVKTGYLFSGTVLVDPAAAGTALLDEPLFFVADEDGNAVAVTEEEFKASAGLLG